MLRGWVAALPIAAALISASPAAALPGPDGALSQPVRAAACVAHASTAGITDPAACVPAPGLRGATASVLEPRGRHLYVAGDGVTQLNRDPQTGALSQPGAAGACLVTATEEPTSPTVAEQCELLVGLGEITDLALPGDGRHLYATADGAAAVLLLQRDDATGALEQPRPAASACEAASAAGPALPACVPAAPLVGPQAIELSPDGRHAYVAASDSGAVVAFQRDLKSGELAPVPGAGGCHAHIGSPLVEAAGPCRAAAGLVGASAITISPDGRHVYVASPGSNAVAAFARNGLTGSLHQLDGAAACIVDRTGPPAQGSAPGCSFAAGLAGVDGLERTSDGASVYAASRSGAVVALSRHAFTGALAPVPSCVADDTNGGPADAPAVEGCRPGQGLAGATGLAVSADGTSVYVAAAGSLAIGAFEREPSTGSLMQLPGPAACLAPAERGPASRADAECAPAHGIGAPTSVVVSPDGLHVYAISAGAVAAFSRQHTPVCRDATVRILRNQPARIPLSCSDPDGDPVAISLEALPRRGTLVGDPSSGSIEYIPFPNVVGADRFTYGASDDSTRSASATVTVEVQPPVDRDGPKIRVSARVQVGPSGRARVKVRCPASEPGVCRGTLRIASAARLQLSRGPSARRRVVTFGKVRFRIKPAETRRLALRVGKRKRAIIRRERSVRGRAVAIARDIHGNERATARFIKVVWKR